jgi:tetrahydromethanopterin S-methyltransferase subunit G
VSTEDFKIGLQIVNMIATFGVGIYVWISTQDKVTNKRISDLEDKVDGRIDNYAERIARVEQDLHHAPTQDDIKRLHARIDTIDQRLSRMEGEFKSQNELLRMILSRIAEKGMS